MRGLWLFSPSREEAGKQASSRVHPRQSQEITLRRQTGGSSSTRSPQRQAVKVQPTRYLELITQPGKLCIPASHQNGLPPEVKQGAINMLVIKQRLCDYVSISSPAFYGTFLVSTWLKTLFHWQWAMFALTRSLLRGKIWCFFQDTIHSLTSGVRINTQSLRNNQPHGICLGNTITCLASITRVKNKYKTPLTDGKFWLEEGLKIKKYNNRTRITQQLLTLCECVHVYSVCMLMQTGSRNPGPVQGFQEGSLAGTCPEGQIRLPPIRMVFTF